MTKPKANGSQPNFSSDMTGVSVGGMITSKQRVDDGDEELSVIRLLEPLVSLLLRLTPAGIKCHHYPYIYQYTQFRLQLFRLSTSYQQ